VERTEVAWGEHRPRARLVAVPVVEAHAAAREMRVRAETEARALVEDAELHREAVRDDARSAGRFEGLVEAQELLVDLQRRRAALLEGPSVRRFAIVLGMAVAERILGDRGLTDPEAWGRACAAALEALRPARTLRLRVAPGQGPGVRAALAALPAVTALEVTVEEDATIGEPGCIAESECGRVDGLLSTQLAAIARMLLPEPG
jgi:flagellar biosynthesis/type III secretory pathway protein FliH